jgi:broad specificity phosphatase PhoE
MKWPKTVTFIRHDVSQYNVLREIKAQDPGYQVFRREFEANPASDRARQLAEQMQAIYALKVRDASTPLLDPEAKRALAVGRTMACRRWAEPQAVFVSPYVRATLTWDSLWRGFMTVAAGAAKPLVIEDERVREQDHGLATLYNDWRIFHTLHPEQRELYNLEGAYRYRYPQGENVPDVRERNRSWLGALVRDYAGQHVWVVTHHLNILAARANLERLDEAAFLELDHACKPVNCGVTLYKGCSSLGRNGKLQLASYNGQLWTE